MKELHHHQHGEPRGLIVSVTNDDQVVAAEDPLIRVWQIGDHNIIVFTDRLPEKLLHRLPTRARKQFDHELRLDLQYWPHAILPLGVRPQDHPATVTPMVVLRDTPTREMTQRSEMP